MDHIEIHCNYCGSTNVERLLVPAEFDSHYCEQCEQEARIIEVDISTIPPHTALSFDDAKKEALKQINGEHHDT